ncbi:MULTISPECIES: MocR-like pyridoxine biosynthesis transcription factor PdxR [Exiguobacterium]|uniref:MocR-like pyridoxine biosynthesis transcription factor PdxR n=1 Tax=Exiguobacterium TaxID=33986 RepID=UPI001BE62BC9|nr:MULTISPECIES: PLP-dependent aminotransferase family protein [Exiguobacterium]MCT4778246.1 PLP-dependent aminotransferase family protein [Exiguobacterium aquaticum]MCT4790308.1 PLP-dependent aminotransferase family protein [Exiguobacterium mexicanum]
MDMLTFSLEADSSVPLYEQLYLHIRQAIVDDTLTTGTKLPSKRKLGEFLDVSQTTVELAYAQLLAEGYIESLPRKGFYVLPQEELYVRRGSSVIEPLPMKKSYDFDLYPSQIDTTAFPFERWRRHLKQVVSEENHDLLSLGSVQGDFVLRQEIATYLYHSRGVHCSPEQIVVGSGTEQLLPQLLELLPDTTTFGIEDPGYPLTRQLFAHQQRTFIPIPVDESGVRVDLVEQASIDALYVTPAHQFPTGTILSVSRRQRLLNWASERQTYVIEDDYDSEFRYSGKPIPSLQSMDQNERVIYLSTFSKSLMPSLRIGYMVLPPPLLNRYRERYRHFTCSVPRFEQHTLAAFMATGDFEKHLNRMRKTYRRKLEIIITAFKPYEPTVSITGASAGLHVVLSVRTSETSGKLKRLAENSNIRINAMTDYRIESSDTMPQFLFGFAALSEETLPAAVSALMSCWNIEKGRGG